MARNTSATAIGDGNLRGVRLSRVGLRGVCQLSAAVLSESECNKYYQCRRVHK